MPVPVIYCQALTTLMLRRSSIYTELREIKAMKVLPEDYQRNDYVKQAMTKYTEIADILARKTVNDSNNIPDQQLFLCHCIGQVGVEMVNGMALRFQLRFFKSEDVRSAKRVRVETSDQPIGPTSFKEVIVECMGQYRKLSRDILELKVEITPKSMPSNKVVQKILKTMEDRHLEKLFDEKRIDALEGYNAIFTLREDLPKLGEQVAHATLLRDLLKAYLKHGKKPF